MSAAESIWGLVSGLPRGKREARRFMVLQAYIDDSGSDPSSSLFVLGGFVASADDWAAFSDQWEQILLLEPKLNYFKMSEARALHGQFTIRNGWTRDKRDERVFMFLNAVNRFAVCRIHVSLDYREFDRFIRSMPAPSRTPATDSPYVMLFTRILLLMATFSPEHGINEPCDFIFDTQTGFSELALGKWPDLRKNAIAAGRPDVAERFGHIPSFRCDKEFLPLQAADLYVWQVRRQIEHVRTLIVPKRAELQRISGIPRLASHVSTREMASLRDFLLGQCAQFIENNPELPMLFAKPRKGG